jgi:hypothetical protein
LNLPDTVRSVKLAVADNQAVDAWLDNKSRA